MALGYAERAEFYAVETRDLTAPVLLRRYVRAGQTVAEAPSGTGHYLADYARLPATPVLLDAEPAMVVAAQRNLAAAGIRGEALCHRIGTDPPPRRFPAVVSPNAALNQLAAAMGVETALNGLAGLLEPGGVLLVSALLFHEDGTVDVAPCYDPAATPGVWLREWTRPDGRGGTLTRFRRQRRDGREVRVEFRRVHDGVDLGISAVRLALLTLAEVKSRRWQLLSAERRPGGMTEIALRKESE